MVAPDWQVNTLGPRPAGTGPAFVPPEDVREASEPLATSELDLETALEPNKRAPQLPPGLGSQLVAFRGLSYHVRNAANRKQKEIICLLRGLDGCLQPGRMTALMGPTGCGKTTLLDVLAGRKTVGTITGDVLYGGRKPSQHFLRQHTGYVEQNDTMLGALTVREMLMYTAEMKRPIQEPRSEKRRAVDDLLTKLGLQDCANRAIGDALTRGISGGQAKRTSIGVALVCSPDVLYLDEPLSGLDSHHADEVIEQVKQLTTDGITICATVHSPTSYVFRLFDDVVIMLRGHIVYQAPNDPHAIVSHFTSVQPDILPHDKYDNVTEWVTKAISTADGEVQANVFAEAYRKSSLSGRVDALLQSVLEHEGQPNIDRSRGLMEAPGASSDAITGSSTLQILSQERAAKRMPKTTVPAYHAIIKMMQYRSLANYRSLAYLMSRAVDKLVFTLIMATLYWGTGKSLSMEEGGRQNPINTANCLIMWCALPAAGATALPQLLMERPLFVRERSDGLFTPLTYLMFKIVDELVVLLPLSLLFGTIIFFALQLQGNFWLFWGVYVVDLFIGVMTSYVAGSLVEDVNLANMIVPTFAVTMLFFGGLLITYDDMPDAWKCVYHISFVRYAWGALMLNQFGDGYDIPWAGDTFLGTYNLAGDSKWRLLGILACFPVVGFVIAWAGLTYKRMARR